MKNIVRIAAIFVVFLFYHSQIYAQVKTKIYSNGIPQDISKTTYSTNEIFVPEPANFEELIKSKGETETTPEYKNKFAVPVVVGYDFMQLAQKSFENDNVIYTLKIIANKALNISLKFSEFQLSENSLLSISTDYELTDSITSKENNSRKIWATRIYQGDFLNLTLSIPQSEINSTRIRIDQVNFGFLPMGAGFFGNPGASATCNINVLCAQGNGWENERNSVALIVSGGWTSCTGTLVMNTCGTNIPFLLTANHCLDGNVANWVFQFQTWSSTCNPNGTFREDLQFNGCQLRANNVATDFALVELNQVPQPNSGISYSGWDRTATPSISGSCIHHPRGDLMKISMYNQQAVAVPWFTGAANHWRVTFNQGIVQHGSSGSALFNQDQRLVGQLHGNQNDVCGYPGTNNCWCVTQIPSIGEYGRFDLSWTGGGTNATRLSNWLDPSGTGANTTNTTSINNLIPTLATGLTISGAGVICSSETYTVNVPAGTIVSLSAASSPKLSFISFTTTGNQITITRNGTAVGTVLITATVTTICGTFTVTRQVYLGPVPATIIGPYDPIQHTIMGVTCIGQQYYFIAAPNDDPTATYTWTLFPPPGSQEPTYLFSGPQPYISFSEIGCYTLRVAKTSSCGGTVITERTICTQECLNGFRLAASPNPAANQINVTIDDESNDIKSLGTDTDIKFEMFNFNSGVKQKQWSYKNTQSQFNLNLSGLNKGIYILRATKGKYTQSIKIIVN